MCSSTAENSELGSSHRDCPGWWRHSHRISKRTAPIPDGGTVEVLVHREGFYPQTGLGGGGVLLILFSVIRNRGRKWSWAVSVRKQVRGIRWGYGPLLLHEVFPDPQEARRRADILAGELASGSVTLPEFA